MHGVLASAEDYHHFGVSVALPQGPLVWLQLLGPPRDWHPGRLRLPTASWQWGLGVPVWGFGSGNHHFLAGKAVDSSIHCDPSAQKNNLKINSQRSWWTLLPWWLGCHLHILGCSWITRESTSEGLYQGVAPTHPPMIIFRIRTIVLGPPVVLRYLHHFWVQLDSTHQLCRINIMSGPWNRWSPSLVHGHETLSPNQVGAHLWNKPTCLARLALLLGGHILDHQWLVLY